jgi:hypothetical protein
MFVFNSHLARQTLAGIGLTPNLRRYADWWLAHMETGGETYDPVTVDLIEQSVVRFEVRPRKRAIWLGAGKVINDGLGVNLAGHDYAAMADEADRPLRMARMSVVSSGCIALQSRWAVNAAGRLHFLKELALPTPPGANGAPRMMTCVDNMGETATGQIQMDKGVMGLAASFDAYPLH